MTGYLANFSIYTLAMVGIIFVALFIFKSVSSGRGFSKKSTFLKIEEAMNLSARKTVYVISAGEEKFLIASDVDKTSLIAKLGDAPVSIQKEIREDKSLELTSLEGLECMDDFASVINFQKEKTNKGPMMRELAKKLSVM